MPATPSTARWALTAACSRAQSFVAVAQNKNKRIAWNRARLLPAILAAALAVGAGRTDRLLAQTVAITGMQTPTTFVDDYDGATYGLIKFTVLNKTASSVQYMPEFDYPPCPCRVTNTPITLAANATGTFDLVVGLSPDFGFIANIRVRVGTVAQYDSVRVTAWDPYGYGGDISAQFYAYPPPPPATYTPSLTDYAASSLSANGRRSLTFSGANTGNAAATYTFTLSCTGSLTSCTFANGTASTTATINPSASTSLTVSLNTGGVGTSGQVKLIMTAPPRPSTGLVEADTTTRVINAADLIAPTIGVGYVGDPITINGTTYLYPGRDTATVTATVCDNDGTVGTPTLTMEGQSIAVTSDAPTTVSGCFTARRTTFFVRYFDGNSDLTFHVSDGVHTTTSQIWYRHSGALVSKPVVTAVQPTMSVGAGYVGADTFVVTNPGPQTVGYSLTLGCYAVPYELPCPHGDTYYVTLAAGASTRVPVPFSLGSIGSSVQVWLDAEFDSALNDTTVTEGRFTASVAATQAPTIAITPTSGTTVTSSPLSQVRIDWCDADDALVQHDVTWQGQLLPDTYVATTRAGCFAAGTSTYNNLAINPWQQTLVATARDAANHTVTSSAIVTYSPALSAFAPRVTATNGLHRLPAGTSSAVADTFTVTNAGTSTAGYALAAACGSSGTLSNCVSTPSSVSLAPGASSPVVVQYTRSGAADLTDTLALVATYTSPLGGVVADTGHKAIVAPSLEVAAVVTPVQSLFQVLPRGTVSQAWFTVHNASSVAEIITLNWVASSGWGFMTTGFTPTLTFTLPLGPGETQYVGPSIVTPSTSGVSGTVTVTASYVTATGQTPSTSASIQLITTGGSSGGGIALSVSGATQPLLAPNTTRTVNFTVQNTGSTTGTANFSKACSGASIASCDAPSPASVSLNGGGSTTVGIVVHTGPTAGQSGTVSLTATSGNVTASGSVAISTSLGGGPLQIRAVSELNSGAAIARDQCLTIAAGDDAAYECGDLRLVHALPTTMTMNRARTPTLIYLSAHAHPIGLITTDVTIDSSICPSQLKAFVRIDGAPASDSAVFTWNGTCGQSTTRRIVVPVSNISRPTGLYHYSIEVNTTINSNQYTQTDTTGVMAVVNRSAGTANLFGTGWWLDGLEQLFAVSGRADQLLWVGGDGSTRLYTQEPETNLFLVQPTLDRPDTLELLAAGAGYRRHLRNGAYVLFNGLMQHTQTVNAQHHITQFNWNSNQLASIALPVPPGSSATPTYTFNYSNGVLASVIAPPNASGARVTTFTRGSDSVAIADPAAPAVRYKSDATNRIVRRTNRMGDATTFDFDATVSLLAHTKLNMNPDADSIARTFCAAEGSGRAACAPSLADPSNVATVYDGPRLPSDVADVTHFYVNRFGAPTRIVDALDHSLTISREDTRWPFAVTALEQANGHRVQATYTSRGLTDSTWDANPYGDGQRAVTRFQWDAIYDKVTQITAPTLEVSRSHYDANGDRDYQEDGRGLPSRTVFTYKPGTRQLATIQIPGNSTAQLQLYDYDVDLGNLQRETTPLGAITNYRTNVIGQVDSVATQLGGSQERAQQLVYDARDRLHIQRDIGPAMETPRGTVPASTLEVTTSYDDEDRTVSVDRKSIPNLANTLGSSSSWTYDAAGRKKSDIEAGGRQQFWNYDQAGNVTSWDAGRGSSALIATTYDALNRPLNRTTPLVTKAAQVGTQALSCGHPARFPYFPYLASGTQYDPTSEGNCDGLTSKPADLVIPSDLAVFSYDDVGNLTTANNNDARIAREYYPNGALKHETQIVAILDETQSSSNRFNTHIYKMGYNYDLSGRRLSRTDTLPDCSSCSQSYHYDPITGFLDWGSDAGAGHTAASLSFGYDGVGRLTSLGINGSTATMGQHFDPDGRVDARNVMAGVTTVFGDAMSYDKVGHNTGTTVQSDYSLLAIPTTNQVYSGLGALAYFSQERSGALHEDQYQTDGMSNRTSNGRWFDAGQMHQESRYTRERLDAVIPVLSWQSGDPAPPTAFQKSDTTTIEYGIAGSVEYTRRAAIKFVESLGWGRDADNDVWDWNAYGADERLRMSQHSTMTQSGPKVVTTDYRYDALGRRVAVRTRWANCQGTAPDCVPMIQHTVWDGDQVLMERRIALDESPAYGNWYGSVRYTHAGGIDEPLVIWKTDVGGWVPHRSWRGVYEAGTPVDGTSSNVTWPGQSFDVFYAPDARVNPVQASHWMGSLIEGKTDASGLQYMRNRYYDPRTGRFTQEDPLGLAGGLNLYGFAGGDPVNFSDPFGLFACKDANGNVIDCPEPAGGPPVKLPAGKNGKPNEWVPIPGSAGGSRGTKYKPKYPAPGTGGGQPGASWDPEGHWDVDDGTGSRKRYAPDGTEVDHSGNPVNSSPQKRTWADGLSDLLDRIKQALGSIPPLPPLPPPPPMPIPFPPTN